MVGQAKRFAQDIAVGVKRAGSLSKQLALEGMRTEIERMVPLIRQVMKQTRARIFRGDTSQRGQDRQPVRAVNGNHPQRQSQQADRVRQDGETARSRKPDHHRLRSLRAAAERFGPAGCRHRHASSIARTRAAFGGGWRRILLRQERDSRKGKRCQAHLHSQSFDQKPRTQTRAEKRWFCNGQKWRTGCEGRISVVKRRHGLTRCRYKGEVGMHRWVGLGVIADSLVNIGRAMEKQAVP
jgi:transposase, IS5 family